MRGIIVFGMKCLAANANEWFDSSDVAMSAVKSNSNLMIEWLESNHGNGDIFGNEQLFLSLKKQILFIDSQFYHDNNTSNNDSIVFKLIESVDNYLGLICYVLSDYKIDNKMTNGKQSLHNVAIEHLIDIVCDFYPFISQDNPYGKQLSAVFSKYLFNSNETQLKILGALSNDKDSELRTACSKLLGLMAIWETGKNNSSTMTNNFLQQMVSCVIELMFDGTGVFAPFSPTNITKERDFCKIDGFMRGIACSISSMLMIIFDDNYNDIIHNNNDDLICFSWIAMFCAAFLFLAPANTDFIDVSCFCIARVGKFGFSRIFGSQSFEEVFKNSKKICNRLKIELNKFETIHNWIVKLHTNNDNRCRIVDALNELVSKYKQDNKQRLTSGICGLSAICRSIAEDKLLHQVWFIHFQFLLECCICYFLFLLLCFCVAF